MSLMSNLAQGTNSMGPLIVIGEWKTLISFLCKQALDGIDCHEYSLM